jgi:hypothetical protein
MVRSITTTLTTAIGSKTRRPAIKLTAEDHINHLNQSIATAGNADGPSDMCVADDGSIIRVRITRDTTSLAHFTQSFQWQRITDPTNATQWTTWHTFSGGSGNVFDQGGCAVSNNSDGLRAFAQQGTGGAAIWNWYSFDGGQTWSAGPAVILTPPGNALTKGIGSAGNKDVFFLYDVLGGEQVGASFYNGAWSALVAGTLPVIFDGKGLAVVWNSGTAQYTICYADPYTVYSATYTPGSNTWAAVGTGTLTPQNTTAIGRRSPRLSLIDGIHHLVYIEEDGGLYTGTVYNYPRVRQSVDLINWSNGFILHDMPSQFNCNLLQCTPPNTGRSRYVAATLPLVELGTTYAQSDPTQYIDLSNYVLEYKREEEIGHPGQLIVLLDNSSGALNSSVSQYGSTYKPISINTALILSEGYYTGTPPTTREVVQVGKYRIKQIAFQRAPGKSIIQIMAQDITNYFDSEARYQASYVNNTVQALIQNISTLAGVLNTNVPALSQLLTSVPTFVLHAGQKYRHALDELARVGWVEYFLDHNEILQIKQLNANDATVWTYNPEIETLVIGTDDERANHIIVSGKPPAGPNVPIGSVTNAEAFDDTHLHVTGLERFMAYTDIKLVTQTLCQNKATFLLQQAQRNQVAHHITVPANPALQLLDIITVIDQNSSVSGTGQTVNSRIYKQEVAFHAEKAEFEQIIYLEGI